MAVFRPIQISFWQKKFVLKLTPEQKYFYIYLLTNSKTSQCGIYELPIKIIEIETGYNHETVTKLLENFIQAQKIRYDYENEEIFILNWVKYNPVNNINVSKCVISELKEVKNESFRNDFFDTCCKFNINSGYLGEIEGACKGLTSNKQKHNNKQKQSEGLPFDLFWNAYDKKKGDKEKLTRKWEALNESDRTAIMEYIPKYKESQPDKQYRKDPQTFLNNKSWNDELIYKNGKPAERKTITLN